VGGSAWSILASEEMTVTILQGRGTALYTPLEQYGGDSGHTDARSDIYSFGATFYHLLTNTSPAEARERFLHPDSLVPPREINSNLSARTERAILWAMSLHPDERPQNINELRQSLFGNLDPITQSRHLIPRPILADLMTETLRGFGLYRSRPADCQPAGDDFQQPAFLVSCSFASQRQLPSQNPMSVKEHRDRRFAGFVNMGFHGQIDRPTATDQPASLLSIPSG
jgi:serine/threonine protein kinase